MAKTLQEVLGFENLTGVITDPKGGVPDDIIPPEFMSITKGIEGDTATYTKVAGNRQTARLVHKGNPSVRTKLAGVSEIPVKLMNTFEHQFHKADTLIQLRNFENESIQQKGMAEVARQVALFRQRFNNLRMSTIYSILKQGKIYFDGEGNLQLTDSGAVTTIDYGIGANNLHQLNGIIAASWATDTTDIPAHIKGVKKAARQTTGYPIELAFYGEDIFTHLASNDFIGNLLNGSPPDAQAFLKHEIPNGFLNLTWIPVEQAFFEDFNGTNREWFDGDAVIFTPRPDATWWETLEGTTPVPTNMSNVTEDATGALGDITMVTGMGSYATLKDDPVAIKHYGFDTFLTVLKVPDAIFIADTVF